MKINIDPDIWKHYPHLKLGVLIASQLNNHRQNDEPLKELRRQEKEVKSLYEGLDLAGLEKLIDWREAYRFFGYKPSMARSSCEALLRRAIKKNPIPDINPIVNIYNSLSLKHLLPIGGDDLDRVEGELSLKIARGGEPFRGIGSEKTEEALSSEVIYCDDREVTCKAWNFRECDKTKITEETERVLFVVEGLEHTSLGEVAQVLKELKKMLSFHCGGSYETYLLDSSFPQVDRDSWLENRQIPIEIPPPSYHKHGSFQLRKEKLEDILGSGIDPYPAKFNPSQEIEKVIESFEGESVGTFEEAESGKTPSFSLAGRIVLFRAMGTNVFGHILDGGSQLQFLCNKHHTSVKGLNEAIPPLKFIEKKLDLGDIIGIYGHMFRTNKRELTLYVKELTLLCKTLLPLPDKHKGIVDKGIRYRKRWLDLIAHPEVGKQLRLRSQILSIIRTYYKEHGFVEVETPILQNIYGGAAAKPFITHHNALSQDMFCRIALEIALKKLVVGGMHRVYEIGKVFRNEGIDKTHNPEFTMLEAYRAYWDYNDVMVFVEEMYARIALELFGTTRIGKRIDHRGISHKINLKTPWVRMTMKGAISTYAKIDVDRLSEDQMRKKLAGKEDKVKLEKSNRGQLIAMLFEAFVEEHLIQPHHITDHPIETTPLCKLHRVSSERDAGIVERFESFILGVECCNAYTELNDPILQRKLLEDQAKEQAHGDEEASPMDEEFIEAICQGMPPTGGLGIGIDRLCMLFADVSSIRDVLFFPVMRPEE